MAFNTFKHNLRNASVKLQRAKESSDGFDPQSGYTEQEIVDFLVMLPELGNNEQLAAVKATLRRYGFVTEAESFAV